MQTGQEKRKEISVLFQSNDKWFSRACQKVKKNKVTKYSACRLCAM